MTLARCGILYENLILESLSLVFLPSPPNAGRTSAVSELSFLLISSGDS